MDPDDKEFKETIQNIAWNWKHRCLLACLVKLWRKIVGVVDPILEVAELTRLHMGNTLPNHHEHHIAGLRDNSFQHFNLVHKFIPMPQALKIPAAKAAVDKESEKLVKFSALNLTKVRSKKTVIDEARTSGAKVNFASSMDICHLKNAELETQHQKCKRRIVLRCDIVKDDSGSYAVFTEQGSSASQMTRNAIWENPVATRLVEFFQLGMLIRTPSKRGFSYLCMWMTSNWLEWNSNINPMWNLLIQEVNLWEPASFLDHVYLGCTQRQCQIDGDIVDKYRTMF